MIDILECEGYKMFRGTMLITPVASSGIDPYYVSGVWLFKPEYKCWYCNGRSFPMEICSLYK